MSLQQPPKNFHSLKQILIKECEIILDDIENSITNIRIHLFNAINNEADDLIDHFLELKNKQYLYEKKLNLLKQSDYFKLDKLPLVKIKILKDFHDFIKSERKLDKYFYIDFD